MQRVLTAKRSFRDAEVRAVWERIGDLVTAEEAEEAVTRAAAATRTALGDRIGRAVYGWSGGKDSVALQVVMEAAGVRRAVLGIIPAVEFHSYLDWVNEHAPAGLTVIRNTTVTLPWLASRMRLVFPQTSRDAYFWALASARFAQNEYQRRHSPPVQVFGRRTQDGNICGRDGFTRAAASGIVSFNPLRDWPHELVLGVVHHYRRALPPTYAWPHGWSAGTGAWPGRRPGPPEDGWAETYRIEPARVREAARHMPAAADWLTRHHPAGP